MSSSNEYLLVKKPTHTSKDNQFLSEIHKNERAQEQSQV